MTTETTKPVEGTAEFYRGHASLFLSALGAGRPAEAVDALAGCLAAAFTRGGEVAGEAMFVLGWRLAVQMLTQVMINDGQEVFAGRLREQFSSPPAPASKEAE